MSFLPVLSEGLLSDELSAFKFCFEIFIVGSTLNKKFYTFCLRMFAALILIDNQHKFKGNGDVSIILFCS
jgi:hypothetical protein